MELKTFGEDSFDPKQWINKAWSSSGNQEKEMFVNNTVSRLQLYMKQLTNTLDETTTQIVSSVPRVLQDASSLQLEAVLLQQQLDSLEQKVQSVQQQTGQSIDSLQRIDQLKSRLENAASGLREADKWAVLAASLEDLLESGVPTQGEKLKELAEQVSSMTASLEVLSDAPDYEAKRLQLETLYNRLEAAVSPPLIDALTQMDADRTSLYVSVFRGMSRSVSAARCWRRAAATRLQHSWRTMQHTIAALTSSLLQPHAHTQVDWLTNVLESATPISELIRLYTDLLLSLDPSPTKLISASLKLRASPEESILLLEDLRRDIEDLVNSIQSVIDAPRQNKESIPTIIIKEFHRAAYAPLREVLPKYTEMQTQVFLAHLKDPALNQDDLLEQSRSIVATCERYEGWVMSAHVRARNIAGDAMYVVYMPAVESLLSSLSNLISAHSRRIETSFLSSISLGQNAGVLSNCFPAALILESAVAVLIDAMADLQKKNGEDQNSDDIRDLPSLILETEAQQRLQASRLEPPTSVSVLKRTKNQLRTLAKAVLRSPIDIQLDKIPHLSVWNNNDALSTDLPDFALSPQEYITEIGQYLMTLPQHLEMHVSMKQAPLQFLSDICTHTCEVYAEKILNIRNMDALGTKRCLNDIVYLSSVVEDLGSTITPALRNLEKSLRVATPSQSTE